MNKIYWLLQNVLENLCATVYLHVQLITQPTRICQTTNNACWKHGTNKTAEKVEDAALEQRILVKEIAAADQKETHWISKAQGQAKGLSLSTCLENAPIFRSNK